MMPIAVSSMTGAQFWNILKTEADAISWNLRDALRQEPPGASRTSLHRAVQSSERIVALITERTENFRRHILDRRNAPIRK